MTAAMSAQGSSIVWQPSKDSIEHAYLTHFMKECGVNSLDEPLRQKSSSSPTIFLMSSG